MAHAGGKRWARRLVVVLLVVVVLLLLAPLTQTICWVGYTDLEVEFVVSDDEDERPIQGATVSIFAQKGGFCDEREEQQFSLTTDSEGVAKRVARGCMCFGTKNWRLDTFAFHLPYWWFRASAPGYVTSKSEFLDDMETMKYARQVRRGEGMAHLTVRIRLRRLGR